MYLIQETSTVLVKRTYSLKWKILPRQKIITYHYAKDVFQIMMNKGVSVCVII